MSSNVAGTDSAKFLLTINNYYAYQKFFLRESFGDACIIDPWGTVIARGSPGSTCHDISNDGDAIFVLEGRPGLVIAELDMKRVGELRKVRQVYLHHFYIVPTMRTSTLTVLPFPR